MKFSLISRLKSFTYAFNGIKSMLVKEHNARIHVFASLICIAMGFIFSLSPNEWALIGLSIGFVFSFELVNTAIENLADIISPERNEQIKRIKDLSAGAVLVAAITAFIIGVIIFLPKILALC